MAYPILKVVKYSLWEGHSCLENPHGERSLTGYSPWGHKESDTTERLSQNTVSACNLGQNKMQVES